MKSREYEGLREHSSAHVHLRRSELKDYVRLGRRAQQKDTKSETEKRALEQELCKIAQWTKKSLPCSKGLLERTGACCSGLAYLLRVAHVRMYWRMRARVLSTRLHRVSKPQ